MLEQARLTVGPKGALTLGPWGEAEGIEGRGVDTVMDWVCARLRQVISIGFDREMARRLADQGVQAVYSLDVDDGPLVYWALRFRAGEG